MDYLREPSPEPKLEMTRVQFPSSIWFRIRARLPEFVRFRSGFVLRLQKTVWTVCLEFMFSGTITLEKSTFTSWSKLRAYLSKKIAAAAIVNAASSRGKENSELGESAMVTSALAEALSKATQGAVSARSLCKGASLPVTEDDLLSSVQAFSDDIQAFMSQNALGKRLHFHASFGAMSSKVDDMLKDFIGKNPETACELKDILNMFGTALPLKLGWTEFAAETVEFSVREGAFPTTVVTPVFDSKETAEAFGSLRASYTINCLCSFFGEEGDYIKLAGDKLKGLQDFLARFAKPGTEMDKLLTAFGRWDMALKPKTVDSWAHEWATKLESLIASGDLSFLSIYKSMMAVVCKGKIVDKSEIEGLAGLEGVDSQSSGSFGVGCSAVHSSQID